MKLFEKRRFCVLCRKYVRDSRMRYKHEGIGMCEDCHGKLTQFRENSFEGPGNIRAVFAAFLYEGAMRDGVKSLKFSGQTLYGELFGEIIAEKIADVEVLRSCDMIIPVPLHMNRLAERGYNQSEILAEKTSEVLGVPMVTDVLFRVRDTKRQSSLKGLDRVENVKEAFFAHSESVKGKKIILVDDICTMGETLKACESALKKAGADEVYAVTLCINP